MKNPAFSTQEPEAAQLLVSTTAFENGKPIPPKYAFCQPDGQGKTKEAGNVNPAIKWAGAPPGTASYALICVDPDVPAKFDDANQDGKTIAKDFPRQNFYHWVLYDISPTLTAIEEGADSAGPIQGGKPVGRTAHGITGPNSYAQFGGSHGGYDGPCPPWNDERMHHYHFVVYALDVPSLGLASPVDGPALERAIAGHILAKGEMMGTYTTRR